MHNSASKEMGPWDTGVREREYRGRGCGIWM